MSYPPTSAAGSRGTALAVLVVALCWTVVLFDGLDLFIYGAVLPDMLDDPGLGLTPGRAGDLGSWATFGMLLGALSAGTVTDWIGRKKVIIGCTTVFSLASAVCAMAPNLGVFGVARFIAGVGLGGLLPTTITLVAEYAPRGRGNLMIGLLMTAHQAGGILAALLGLWMVEPLGWRSVFWVGLAPLIVAVPLVALHLPESLGFLMARGRTDEARRLAERYQVELPATAPEPAARPDRRRALAMLFSDGQWKKTILFWCASFGGLLLVYGVSTWLPTMMRGQGYELGSALAFLIVINVGGIVGMLVAGRIADRFGAARVAAVWFGCTAIGIYLLGIHMPLALTYVVVFLTGLWLFSAQTMVYATVAGRSTTENRATAVGWTSGMGRFGAVFGPWLGGRLVANGAEDWGFTVFAATALLATVLIGLTGLRSVRQTPRSDSAEPLSTTG
ncbi:aromatic acid/H+ symport family MFS transporter [Streptomyces luomodiensis]|uniref:Aromatic acid/H+ symport family MFS transporter n=1 Tax=Streptomyces luomodiensis TaxID=3026192 RepID=A0ABY9VEQ6_9ACTN|nr:MULTISPECIES: aromatic acid/H+ symport family MFS transporter [unclassified Streptomyces]WAP59783.1 aromatic acid/H+ symport family MFS transporter [Streptomyces sp. S465]WNF00420.1 aromatic acid/H+ symport family MFS transporter [Streptomyces sp. SCA4-21]